MPRARKPLSRDDLPSEEDLERFGDEFRLCPLCKRQIYDQAEMCPKCGYAFVETTRERPAWRFFVILLLILAMIMISIPLVL